MTECRQGSLIWIQGAGEQASGVAWCLIQAGYRVIAAEIAAPTAVRRLVSFSEAIYDGHVEVDGVVGVRMDELIGAEPGRVNVIVDPTGDGIEASGASAVIDARLTKQPPASLPHGSIPLIGLGPGFVVGRDADLVIETHRSAGPGQVVSSGEALPYTGIPGDVGGESLGRVLRSPADGYLQPFKTLGDLVNEGDLLAVVADHAVTAPFDGRLRGLIHPVCRVHVGMKIGDVDPRGENVNPLKISDKALAIGDGVLKALLDIID